MSRGCEVTYKSTLYRFVIVCTNGLSVCKPGQIEGFLHI